MKTDEKEWVSVLDEHTIEITLPNKLGYERIAMACSASFAKFVGFLPERIEDIKTVVAEACINAMEHGNMNHPDKRVRITIDYRDGIFRVSVMDQGGGLDNTSLTYEEPDIDKKIENLQTSRGLGMFLIKQLVDQVEFNKVTDEGHMLRMVLKLKG